MDKFSIVDLNKLTWQLNVALMGGVFAIFSLIYNDYYIYYGLVTFVFGVINHIVFCFWAWFYPDGSPGKHVYLAHISNVILAIIWVFVLVCIYHS
jgi:hypothetical protein